MLQELPNDFSVLVHQLIKSLQQLHDTNLAAPIVVKQNEPSEFRFLQQMVEDKIGNTDSETYVDYLCRLHALIQQKV